MNTNVEKLRKIISEMFLLDYADLDFGIFRIMQQRKKEIENFLDTELEPTVQKAFADYMSKDQDKLNAELQKAIEEAKNLGADPETLPKIQSLRSVIKQGADVEALENEVYSHLVSFFSRYYDNADFISQRRYKSNVYAIPYEGEEVKLHWANADQYYIKTSEYFKNFSFKLASGKVVSFKVAEAESDSNNNKSLDEKNRRFILSEERKPEVEGNSLNIYFEYRDDGKKDKQDKLNQDALATIFKMKEVSEWKAELSVLAGTEKNKQRTILEKYLTNYTSRNTFDYFIHKDLDGFLRRELDFYIKNEVMFLDDIENESAPKVEEYLSKIKAIRAITGKIISFLAQLENFQKKLYEKKKFVVESGYCMTIDRVPEDLHDDIIKNKAQLEDWLALNFIDAKTKVDKVYLKENPTLVIDTKFYAEEFVNRLLGSFDDLDEQTNGLLVNSENFQGLNFLTEKYKEKIKCIYIDPPYNTDASKIAYKNGYEHSSWISLMESRLVLARNFLNDQGVIELAIDDFEFRYVNILMDVVFNINNAISNIAIYTNPKGRDQGFVAQAHDYTIMYAKNKQLAETNNFILSEEDFKKKFAKSKEGVAMRELPLKRTGTGKRREERPYMYFPFLYDISNQKLSVIPEDEYKNIYKTQTGFNDAYLMQLKSEYEAKGYSFIMPVSEKGELLRWRWGYESCVSGVKSGALFVKVAKSEGYSVYQYDFGDNEATPKSMWTNERYDASSKGTNLLESIIPNNPFTYPKSIFTVEDSLIIGAGKNDYILDFFAGSGTTGHAVINLNRKDEGSRKYILVEMGEYFNEVLKTRIKKVIFSDKWKYGKTLAGKGVSHIFKYLKLETYEDVLNNL
jgi:adenine-specific DNA-methyltransferase